MREKWLKLMYIYWSYRKIKTRRVSLFWTTLYNNQKYQKRNTTDRKRKR